MTGPEVDVVDGYEAPLDPHKVCALDCDSCQ